MSETVRAIRAYHQSTKHSFEAYAPSPGFLDWDAQPDPFRRYVGAPEIALPLVTGTGLKHYDDLYAADGTPHDLDAHALGLFFELALGLSAWKVAGPERWALRNNPSSGNLHPTEGYLILWCAASADLIPGVYHYAPREHLLERRAVLAEATATEIAAAHPDTFGAVALTTITWREEWKYGSRAFRYCQMDVGHALASQRVAAGVLGWRITLDSALTDDRLAVLLGLDRDNDRGDAEPELPDCLAVLGTGRATAIDWQRIAGALRGWQGRATPASAERVAWPQIAQAVQATYKHGAPDLPAPIDVAAPTFPPREGDACALIRQRRSAQRMDGETSMARIDFERGLSRTLPATDRAPFDALGFAPALNLLLFVHRVSGMDPGLYALIRAPQLFDDFRAACTAKGLAWTQETDTELPLYRLSVPTDCTSLASKLSCYQGIAGRGAYSVGMIGAIGPVLDQAGAWAYRRLHWEAGMIAQVLYLEAEACGLRGTGIGCFFDDGVHDLLGLDHAEDAPWQTLYHFTAGGPLEDGRLQSEPAYAHLGRCWE